MWAHAEGITVKKPHRTEDYWIEVIGIKALTAYEASQDGFTQVVQRLNGLLLGYQITDVRLTMIRPSTQPSTDRPGGGEGATDEQRAAGGTHRDAGRVRLGGPPPGGVDPRGL
jgi:hypothetical protein